MCSSPPPAGVDALGEFDMLAGMEKRLNGLLAKNTVNTESAVEVADIVLCIRRMRDRTKDERVRELADRLVRRAVGGAPVKADGDDDTDWLRSVYLEMRRVWDAGRAREGGPDGRDLRRLRALLFTVRDIRDATDEPSAYDMAGRILKAMSGIMTEEGRRKFLEAARPRPGRMSNKSIFQN